MSISLISFVYLIVFYLKKQSIAAANHVDYNRYLTGELQSENTINETVVYNELKGIQLELNEKIDTFCYHGPSGTKNAYMRDAYKGYTHGRQVLVYPFCLMAYEMGNRLGNYFTELACAEATGVHFMTVHPQWDIKGAITNNSTKLQEEAVSPTTGLSLNVTMQSRLTFLRSLPDIVVHPQPADRQHAIQRMNHFCKCNRYCWQNVHAPWVNHTSSIRYYMKKALKAYYNVIKVENPTTSFDPEVDITNAPTQVSSFPLIPDVAIQYRCGDNIAFSYMYGILPFTAFDSRIPADAKYIYVLSDHPSRAAHSPYTGRCKTILEKLLEYLTGKFPQATILIKRGGDIFLDMARLSFAKVTICSASTYCFWPALSTDGQAYFPVTSLIAGADSIELAPNFGKHFHWINEPKIISNFKGYRPWTAVLDVLTGKVAPPS